MSSNPLPWDERLLVSVPEAAAILDMSRTRCHDLIKDWAFGDPDKLPRSRGTKPRKKIPTDLVKAYAKGQRQYPPDHDAPPTRASA